MGQVRGLLRGISYSSGDTPAGVLRQLDRAVRGLALDTMATCLVARLEPDDDGAGTTLRWSNAGHLPPAVLTADGTVTLLDDGPVDLLLGVAPDTARTDRAVVLEPGATVLLYTDGLVERRDQVFDEGIEQLQRALAGLRQRPVEDLSDALLAGMLPAERAEDDVALVAVRLAG